MSFTTRCLDENNSLKTSKIVEPYLIIRELSRISTLARRNDMTAIHYYTNLPNISTNVLILVIAYLNSRTFIIKYEIKKNSQFCVPLYGKNGNTSPLSLRLLSVNSSNNTKQKFCFSDTKIK